MDTSTTHFRVTALLLSLFVVLAGTGYWLLRKGGVDDAFAKNFIDLNRRTDERARSVAYDPDGRVLAIGYESGRLQLWDPRAIDSRISVAAYDVPIDHLAIGSADGIVLTSPSGGTAMGLSPQGMPKVWDARTGALLHALPGEWIGGPVVAGAYPGVYVIASGSSLRVYDHPRRVVGDDAVEIDGVVTALGADPVSRRIAVGTNRGEILLFALDNADLQPRLRMIGRTSISLPEPRSDVLAVMLRDEGRKLVTVNWLPRATRNRLPPIVTGQQTEIVQWDTATWKRERTFPVSLEAVHWASYTPGESWLVLAGNAARRGKIELVDLEHGDAWRYRANTTHPVAVLIPELRSGLILQSGGATEIRYIDQKG